jgi:hypothetical protein
MGLLQLSLVSMNLSVRLPWNLIARNDDGS